MSLISLTPSCGLWLVKTGKKSYTELFCKSLSSLDIWHNFLLEADAVGVATQHQQRHCQLYGYITVSA